ncbi:ECF transporter S component [Cerasibacillus quisquiliarum]|uniref:Riboflavin transporter n=1 Tax=Cerasibacillus quisquiliarum TaxID=227865 RepID=A0A511V0K2_9BACI|nr:ECF transporter S component [Cerasibacillus quisquiliarum]GEN32399.1 riboflavin transporter [Cerasibacillus quisquiliarum]
MQTNMKSSKLVKLTILSILGTVSLLLFFLNFPLPFLPAYLKIDFSEVPALIAALIFSPMAGVIVEAIKNLLYLAIGGGEPVGVTANFLAGVLFIVPVAVLYHRYKGTKSIVTGLVVGTIIMAIAMSVLNYLVILPIYAMFMGMEDMALAHVKRAAVLFGILPFNILKGIIVGLVFVPVFLKMRQWIEKKQHALS